MMEKTKKESFWQRWKFCLIGGIVGLLMGYVFSVVFYTQNPFHSFYPEKTILSLFFTVSSIPVLIIALIPSLTVDS